MKVHIRKSDQGKTIGQGVLHLVSTNLNFLWWQVKGRQRIINGVEVEVMTQREQVSIDMMDFIAFVDVTRDNPFANSILNNL
ncbi:MAG: hypothetical protein LW629_10940 [Burkholderiales bacterium]|nr:hypothetical protein [Burkholderiales bacterium]